MPRSGPAQSSGGFRSLKFPWEPSAVRVELVGPGRDGDTAKVKLIDPEPGWARDAFLVSVKWLSGPEEAQRELDTLARALRARRVDVELPG